VSKILKSQSGFADIIAIAIIAILALGLGGYVIYQQKQAQKDYQAAGSGVIVATHKKTVAAAAPAATPPPATTTYVMVKEWGIKVPQIPAGNLISYTYDGANSTIDIWSSEQTALGGSCGQATPRAHVYKAVNGAYPKNDAVFTAKLQLAEKNGLAVKVGNDTYYILSDLSGGVCMANIPVGSTMTNAEVAANAHLITSLKGLIKS
jgi:hypothetical protein